MAPRRAPAAGVVARLAAVVGVLLSGWGPASAFPVVEPASAASGAWSDVLREHLARYPRAGAADVYKFAHQSVFGPAHAVPSTAEARRWVDEELASLAPGPPGEGIADRLGEDPPLVRLNLRPYIAAGGDVAALVEAFAATAAAVRGDPAEMSRRLGAAVAVLRALGRAGDADELAVLAARQEAMGYAAVHHTAAYRDAYAPAYRVVKPELLGAGRAAATAAPSPGAAAPPR